MLIKNSGTGLAEINDMQWSDGNQYFENWPNLLDKLLPDSLSYGYNAIISNTINGEVITPGEQVTLFQIDWLPGVRQFEKDTRVFVTLPC